MKNWESIEMSEQIFKAFDQGSDIVRTVILAHFFWTVRPQDLVIL